MAGREMKASAEFVACVVGLSRGDGEAFSSYSGAGKSCLCYRLVYPGIDDYVDNHPSILALHEFESSAINRDHFLYWGSVFKHFPVKGSKSGSNYAIIQVHVIEHTVFYQDETSQPFPNFGNYRKRIIGSLESPGKLSYKSRDELDISSDTQQYPSKKLNKLSKGYLVVLDVSQIGTAFDAQLQRVEQVLDYLTKHKQKFILVASKRDDSNPNSLRCAQDLKKKYHTILVETSASGNINIRDAFRLLAHKVLKKPEISDSMNSFEIAQQNSLKARSHAKRAFQEFLEEQVVDPKEQLHHLYEHSEFRECKKFAGNFDTGWLFATHILQLYNEEYSDREDANETVTRQEFLESVIKGRPDLSTYSHHLKSWIEFYIGEDQADTSAAASDNREEELDKESTAEICSPERAPGHPTVGNTHAWVTIIDTPRARYTLHSSSTASSDIVSQVSSSVSSAKSYHDRISMSSEDALSEFEPQASPSNCSTNRDSAVVHQHSTGESGSVLCSSVNNESRLSATDRKRYGSDSFEQHNYEPMDKYEPIDDEPFFRQNKPMSTHTSAQRPPAILKANTGEDQIPLVKKIPTTNTNTNTDQPTCSTPQQQSLLNMATPARHDYENHMLNLQRGDGQVSLPPRSPTAIMHAHGQPISPTVCSPPRQVERTNFKRLDTPRTLLAKKLEMLKEMSMTPTPAPDHVTSTKQPEENPLPSTVAQRCNYENQMLPFENQSKEMSSASLPPRSVPRTAATAHTHSVGSPPPMSTSTTKSISPRQKTANIMEQVTIPNSPTQRCDYENHSLPFERQAQNEGTQQPLMAARVRPPSSTMASPPPATPGQETSIKAERRDFSRLETPRTLLTMQSDDKQTTVQEHSESDKKVSTPENPNSELLEAEEPHVRHNYENHSLKGEHLNTSTAMAAVSVSLPPRLLAAASEKSSLSAANSTPRQGETAVAGRRDFSRLATPNTLKRLASLPSGKPSSPSPDYVDEDYINTSLFSMSGLSSPTVQSSSAIEVTPDYTYVDEDYINTALISPSDCYSPSASMLGLATVAQIDITNEADYVNTTPPTTMKRGTRSPLSGENNGDDDLVYDYPDLRNSRLLLSPKSRHVHHIALHGMKSAPLSSNSGEAPIPPRRTKRRAVSDAENTKQHLTTLTTRASLDTTSDKLSDKNGHETSLGRSSMKIGSSDSMSRQDSSQDYVSGYVNTKLERPLPSRKAGRCASLNEGGNPDDSDEELEYDYPNIERTIRFNFGMPSRRIPTKLAVLPPRKGGSTGTTFSSTSSQMTSSNTGSGTSSVTGHFPKWWLQLMEERERRSNNPDLYLHFATGKRKSYQQPARLPPRRTLYTVQEQQHQDQQNTTAVCENRESLVEIDTDEYIVMASTGCTVDDNYVNWETIYNVREYTSSPHDRCNAKSKTLPPRKGVLSKDAESTPQYSRKYSMDDMHVNYYVNVPPRDEPVTLPPRGVLCKTVTVQPKESKPESDISTSVVKKRSSVVEAPQMVKPQVKPKPVILLAKQRNGSVSHSQTGDSKASEVNKPKPKPKPKVRPKPKIDPSTKPKPPVIRTNAAATNSSKEEGKLTATKSTDIEQSESSLSLNNNHLPQPPILTPRTSKLGDHSVSSQ